MIIIAQGFLNFIIQLPEISEMKGCTMGLEARPTPLRDPSRKMDDETQKSFISFSHTVLSLWY